eukprot:3518695-Pleurochrysis_carterae.AAC.1
MGWYTASQSTARVYLCRANDASLWYIRTIGCWRLEDIEVQLRWPTACGSTTIGMECLLIVSRCVNTA